MTTLLLGGLRAVTTVLVAHAFAYFLVGVLPQTGIATLGLSAVQMDALTSFTATIDVPDSYIDALGRLVTIELGKSLDGVPVTTLLVHAIVTSLPVFCLGLAITAAAVVLAFAWPQLLARPIIKNCFEFLTFLPAFVPAFVLLAATVSFGHATLAGDSWQRWWIAGLTVSIMPTALALITIRGSFENELSMVYTRTLRSLGLPERRILVNLRRAVVIQLAAIADKIVTLQIAVLIFTEVIFSMPGFGSMLLLATQRTDINVIIAFVVIISAVVSMTRLLGTIVAARIDPRQRDMGK